MFEDKVSLQWKDLAYWLGLVEVKHNGTLLLPVPKKYIEKFTQMFLFLFLVCLIFTKHSIFAINLKHTCFWVQLM